MLKCADRDVRTSLFDSGDQCRVNSQASSQIRLCPLPGLTMESHVAGQSGQQLPTRFYVYASPLHQARTVDPRNAQRTQIGGALAVSSAASNPSARTSSPARRRPTAYYSSENPRWAAERCLLARLVRREHSGRKQWRVAREQCGGLRRLKKWGKDDANPSHFPGSLDSRVSMLRRRSHLQYSNSGMRRKSPLGVIARRSSRHGQEGE